MKTPGPDHPITVTPAETRWRARYAGHVIADSADALILKEADYPPVVYFPRQDVSMEYMSRTDRHTHCPYKGDASYYSLLMDGQFAENAIWTYEAPYPAMSTIEGRLAFYPDKVEVYAVEGEPATARRADPDIDQAVQHTDAGDGHAQRGHWPSNVEGPGPEGGVR